jgi:biotin carboxylase
MLKKTHHTRMFNFSSNSFLFFLKQDKGNFFLLEIALRLTVEHHHHTHDNNIST